MKGCAFLTVISVVRTHKKVARGLVLLYFYYVMSGKAAMQTDSLL